MQQRLMVFGGAVLAAVVSTAAHGQSNRNYQCTMAGLSRRVEVAYTSAAAVPCEVRYYKGSEGQSEPQVLWSAQNETGYCERQAEEFVAKLQGMGWTCTDAGTSGDTGRPEGDDTAVLGAGREQR
jgi:hypothetical protein